MVTNSLMNGPKITSYIFGQIIHLMEVSMKQVNNTFHLTFRTNGHRLLATTMWVFSKT